MRIGTNSETKTWIKYRVPAYSGWVCVVWTFARIYAGEEPTLNSIVFGLAFMVLCGEIVFLYFNEVSRNARGKETHIREITREREVEIPAYEETELETWVDYDTPNGVASVKQVTGGMTDEQIRDYYKMYPVDSLPKIKQLKSDYKGRGKIIGELLNQEKRLEAGINNKRTDEVEAQGGEKRVKIAAPDPSPTFQWNPFHAK